MQSLRGFVGGCNALSYRRALRPGLRRIELAQFADFQAPHHVTVTRRCLLTSQAKWRKQDQETAPEAVTTGQGSQKSEKSKGTRTSPGKTSLRRVAVEAERSRGGFIKSKGNRRFID